MLSDTVIVALITAPASILAGGSIAGIMTARNAKKLGMDSQKIAQKEQEATEEASVSEQAQNLLKAQFEFLVKPMREDLEKLGRKIAAVEQELKEQRNRYWRLVAYTRLLREWVARHLPDQIPAPPQPPDDLIKDL